MIPSSLRSPSRFSLPGKTLLATVLVAWSGLLPGKAQTPPPSKSGPDSGAAPASLITSPARRVDPAVQELSPAQAKEILSRHAAGSPEIQSVLTMACRSGEKSLAEQALAAEANPNDAADPLSLASGRNDQELVALLISYGADAARSPAALPAAVKNRNAAMAKALLDAGADPNASATDGTTPIGVALASGDLDLARVMLQHGGEAEAFVEPAIVRGDVAFITSLLQFGLTPDGVDSEGNPFIVRAAVEGKLEIVKLLLEKGADVKKPGKEGQAALHYAAVMKEEALLKVLLEGGADVNQPFFSPVKPAFLARVDDENFKKWLQKDSNLTPLMLAASRGDTTMLRQLLEKGAKRGAQTKGWQRYPVVFACDGSHIPAAQILLGRKQAPEEPEYRVTISLSTQKAMLYKNDELVRTSRVSTGRKGFATPAGKFVITDKQKDWMSTIYKVSMPFFMRLNCKEIGMHAGNCPGFPASHGCIRMPRADVQAFFSLLKIGDAVTIEE